MPVKIFFCYAHEDERLLERLKSHLQPLQRQGFIDVWHDRDIDAGTEWESEINQHLNAAQIILLLVSPDFMASDYINNVELKRAVERHRDGEARVIPIILRPAYWQGEPLGKLQALPTDGKPVIGSGWYNLDDAFLNVTEGIRKVILNLSSYAKDNKSQGLQPENPVVHTQTNQNGWESAGAKGEIIGTLANAQQWGQAEAMARSIENTTIRSLIQHKLVDELIKAHQWERAEAITRTIEDRNHKDKALIELVNGLADAEQWARAEATARSIVNISDRQRILNELTRRLANAGEMGRATQLAYAVSDPMYSSSPYAGTGSSLIEILPKQKQRYKPTPAIFIFLIVIVTLVSMLIYFAISHNHIILFLVLSIIVLLIISVIIMIILRLNRLH